MSSQPSPIRVGIIGLSPAGWASWVTVPSLQAPVNSGLYRITTIGGRTPESAQTTAAKYSEIIGHEIKAISGPDCASKMANDPEVDLVVISVQTPYHYETVKPVIDAGKAFFLEWPIGGRQAKAIAEAARTKGVRHMIGLHYKQILALRKVKEIIDSGRIGNVRNTTMKLFQGREIGLWGPERNLKGESVADPKNDTTLRTVMGGHTVPTLELLFGDFTSISATTAIQFPTFTVIGLDGARSEPRTATEPDHIIFTAITTQGIVATVSLTAGYPSGTKKLLDWEIDGSEGFITMETKVGYGNPHLVEPEVYVNGEKVDLEASYPGEGFGAVGNMTRMWTAFAKGDQTGYSTLDDGLKVYDVLNSITKSAEEGRRVDMSA